MNFQLTKEQEFVRKMVREFATNEVEPLAADIDKEHRFPVETVEKMAKYGMLGVPFPTEYGGAGGNCSGCGRGKCGAHQEVCKEIKWNSDWYWSNMERFI